MTHFIIDTPYHKRWWLPDGKHWYNSIIYGSILRGSIINASTGQTVKSWEISLDNPEWQNLSAKAQELANKHYNKRGVTSKC